MNTLSQQMKEFTFHATATDGRMDSRVDRWLDETLYSRFFLKFKMAKKDPFASPPSTIYPTFLKFGYNKKENCISTIKKNNSNKFSYVLSIEIISMVNVPVFVVAPETVVLQKHITYSINYYIPKHYKNICIVEFASLFSCLTWHVSIIENTI